MNIYITFSNEAAEALKNGFNSEENFEAEILTVKDNLYTGPLQFIQEDLGRAHRLTYHNDTLKHFGLPEIGAEDALHNYKLIQSVIAHLETESEEEENTITLWMGQNANDVCGYFWLTQQLQNYCGKVNVIYLNNLPFFNEKGGLFYPTHLSQIPPIEFIKCLKVERKIAIHEFEVEKDEWKAIYENENTYRILDGAKKISCKNEDLFDVTIKMTIMGESVKLGKLVNNLLAKLPSFPNELFLLSRVKALLEQGVLVQKKASKNWRDFEIAKT